MAVSIAALQAFRTLFNYESDTTRFFARNSYTAYIIQSAVIMPLTYSYIQIFQSAQNPSPELTFEKVRGYEQVTTSCVTNLHNIKNGDEILTFGFIYTMLLTLLIIYPLAMVIRQIPGFKSVLG